jgi:hypothetical protein
MEKKNLMILLMILMKCVNRSKFFLITSSVGFILKTCHTNT